MRVLIAGVVGAAVAAVVWLGLEHNLQKDLGWLVCFVGAVTGWAIHKAAGATAPGSYGRGVLAVVLALTAIVGGRQAYAKFMEATSDETVVVKHAVVAPKDDTAEAPKATGDVSDVLPEMEADLNPLGNQKLSLKRRFSEMDSIWMCIGALAAYIIGKGRDQVPVAAKDEEQPLPEPTGTDEAPAE